MCEARKDVGEKQQITVESNVPVEVEVIWGEEGRKQRFVADRQRGRNTGF